ncbi:hypothetical protein FACS1894190_11530 [Spirochaetia bacterium]|nr:hypothetical protein FACS1894190_11530 [Spirochaetia bacterium]
MNNQDYSGALLDFNKAIEQDTLNATLFNNRGMTYYALQEWGKAIADLSEAVKLNPNNEMFKKNLSDTRALQSQVAK